MNTMKVDLGSIDLVFVIAYFIFVLTVGVLMSKRAGKNMNSF
jgi:hypothetical protein